MWISDDTIVHAESSPSSMLYTCAARPQALPLNDPESNEIDLVDGKFDTHNTTWARKSGSPETSILANAAAWHYMS